MLYKIISLDAFLRPCMDDYVTLSSIYEEILLASLAPVQHQYIPSLLMTLAQQV